MTWNAPSREEPNRNNKKKKTLKDTEREDDKEKEGQKEIEEDQEKESSTSSLILFINFSIFVHKTSSFPLQLLQKRSSNLLTLLVWKDPRLPSFIASFLFDLWKTEEGCACVYTYRYIYIKVFLWLSRKVKVGLPSIFLFE